MTSGRFGAGVGGGACAPFAHPWIRACIAISKTLLKIIHVLSHQLLPK